MLWLAPAVVALVPAEVIPAAGESDLLDMTVDCTGEGGAALAPAVAADPRRPVRVVILDGVTERLGVGEAVAVGVVPRPAGGVVVRVGVVPRVVGGVSRDPGVVSREPVVLVSPLAPLGREFCELVSSSIRVRGGVARAPASPPDKLTPATAIRMKEAFKSFFCMVEFSKMIYLSCCFP